MFVIKVSDWLTLDTSLEDRSYSHTLKPGLTGAPSPLPSLCEAARQTTAPSGVTQSCDKGLDLGRGRSVSGTLLICKDSVAEVWAKTSGFAYKRHVLR